jgi:predicted acylesterase/phospholipase RssA
MRKNHEGLRYGFDYTFPITSLLAGADLSTAMREMFGDAQLEDLWLPCFCVSVSLERASQVIHERGPIWKYVRASSSLPGILPPVFDRGEMLVDGGLINNLPTDVMRARQDCGVVIAVATHSEMEAERRDSPPYETSLSGWKVLWRRLNPFRPSLSVPSMGSIMVRVAMLNDAKQVKTARTLANLYFELPACGYGLLDFKAMDTIEQAGYVAARRWITTLADNPTFQALAGTQPAT